jgi:hypothetical protein
LRVAGLESFEIVFYLVKVLIDFIAFCEAPIELLLELIILEYLALELLFLLLFFPS